MSASASACPRCGAAQDGTRSFCTTCGLALSAPVAPVPPVPAPPAAPVCRGCGAQVPGAFCTTCGLPAGEQEAAAETRAMPVAAAAAAPRPAPVPAPDPAPAFASASKPRKRRGGPLLVVLAVLVVLLGGGAGAWLLLGGDEEPASAADPAPRAEPSDVVETSASPTPSASPSAEPSETPLPAVTCWDGTEGPDLAACGEPSDQVGLEWVFPSLVADQDTCSVLPGRTGKLLVNTCAPPVAGVDHVNYSWWGDVEAMLSYYDDEQGSATVRERRDAAGVVLVYRYDSPQQDGTWKAALLYADRPWSVTIYADSYEDRERVLRENSILIRKREAYAGMPS